MVCLLLLSLCALLCFAAGKQLYPRNMTIGLMAVGTTGDLNPYIALGMELQKQGHRVRLATHEDFRKKVLQHGLEFYPLAGNPKVLAEYASSLKGQLIPRKSHELHRMKKMLPMMNEIIQSTYPAMTENEPNSMLPKFKVDAIIANPPSYGYLHVAEKLKVPVQVMFEFPWLKTKELPPTLASGIDQSGPSLKNALKYSMNERFEYLGLSKYIKELRKSMGLSTKRMSNVIHEIRELPYTFTYSPHLLPKFCDWSDKVKVVGTLRLPEDMKMPYYEPSEALKDFLESGDAPIFVGFGSMVSSNSEQLRENIVKAAVLSKQRVLLQSGYTDFSKGPALPKNVFVIGRAPHAWLFQHCSAVVHHGGSGTTATGLYMQKPTFIVPFFGDQFLWGQAVKKAGVGIQSVAIQQLEEATDHSVQLWVDAFKQLTANSIAKKAAALAEKMNNENPARDAVRHFYSQLPNFKQMKHHRVHWMNLSK